MGLSAVVYRNRKNLPFDPEFAGATLDPKTGEYYFLDSVSEGKFGPGATVALARDLGSANTVALLSDAIESAGVTTESLLLGKVLFSGSHSGDTIDSEYFPLLQMEIDQIKRSPQIARSPVLADFLRKIEELVNRASEEGNPIVFV